VYQYKARIVPQVLRNEAEGRKRNTREESEGFISTLAAIKFKSNYNERSCPKVILES
jgi:hypothetical protein